MSVPGNPDQTIVAAEPFLKWAGGKRLLLPKLLPKLPRAATDGRYFEPFLGGGAVFFATEPESAQLSDVNSGLIQTYCAVRDCPSDVIEQLARLKNSAENFYKVRAWRPTTPARKAARFIYLNKTCFNGLYRENLAGEFNVPYGKHPYDTVVCNVEQIEEASRALQGATLRTSDFVSAVSSAERGDFVYFDPPYITGHRNNGFVEYNAKVFSWSDQYRLRRAAQRLVSRGVRVAISNGDHPSIRQLYESDDRFRLHVLSRQSTMASQSKKRSERTELLVVSTGAI
jgi:DNA adenine methylase